MKFRAFITTLLLSLTTFYISLLLISFFMFNRQMNTEKRHGLNEHYLIASSLGKDLAAISNRNGNIEKSIQPLFKFYISYYEQQGMFLEVLKEDELLYSSLPAQHDIPSMTSVLPIGIRKVSIEKWNTNTYVRVIGALPGTENKYYLNYLYNISDRLLEWERMQDTLLWIGLFFSIILAIFLQLSLNRIFKPLSHISAASKKIALGQYENEILVSGHDELTDMAISFNNMSREIRHRIAQLANASEKKQQFVDNFSHEIRTPLTSIYGYAQYLVIANLSEEEKIESAHYIMTESQHILTLADHMLELSTLREQEMTIRKVQVDELFQNVKKSLDIKLAEKRIVLTWNCNVDILNGDPYLLKSLLINLTDNAIKACDPGGHIIWETNNEHGDKVLTVSDNGKGIPLEQVEHITEPFYRIDKSRSRTEGGAGLGLAICEQIIACHNGNLTFESNIDSGTTVKVTFTCS